ncbi:hypothetical protein C4D60_Mb09t26470 [Musa balbisiana]|uniref:Uncharacterized protein n=1 Tax=Musa balbisiana TaxID=52838 RepID=A0A4S8IJ98_MUSBA|nr:hypothetical protein C4D60_Mb09t26470 [Musa balbisiana]
MTGDLPGEGTSVLQEPWVIPLMTSDIAAGVPCGAELLQDSDMPRSAFWRCPSSQPSRGVVARVSSCDVYKESQNTPYHFSPPFGRGVALGFREDEGHAWACNLRQSLRLIWLRIGLIFRRSIWSDPGLSFGPTSRESEVDLERPGLIVWADESQVGGRSGATRAYRLGRRVASRKSIWSDPGLSFGPTSRKSEVDLERPGLIVWADESQVGGRSGATRAYRLGRRVASRKSIWSDPGLSFGPTSRKSEVDLERPGLIVWADESQVGGRSGATRAYRLGRRVASRRSIWSDPGLSFGPTSRESEVDLERPVLIVWADESRVGSRSGATRAYRLGRRVASRKSIWSDPGLSFGPTSRESEVDLERPGLIIWADESRVGSRSGATRAYRLGRRVASRKSIWSDPGLSFGPTSRESEVDLERPVLIVWADESRVGSRSGATRAYHLGRRVASRRSIWSDPCLSFGPTSRESEVDLERPGLIVWADESRVGGRSGATRAYHLGRRVASRRSIWSDPGLSFGPTSRESEVDLERPVLIVWADESQVGGRSGATRAYHLGRRVASRRSIWSDPGLSFGPTSRESEVDLERPGLIVWADESRVGSRSGATRAYRLGRRVASRKSIWSDPGLSFGPTSRESEVDLERPGLIVWADESRVGSRSGATRAYRLGRRVASRKSIWSDPGLSFGPTSRESEVDLERPGLIVWADESRVGGRSGATRAYRLGRRVASRKSIWSDPCLSFGPTSRESEVDLERPGLIIWADESRVGSRSGATRAYRLGRRVASRRSIWSDPGLSFGPTVGGPRSGATISTPLCDRGLPPQVGHIVVSDGAKLLALFGRFPRGVSCGRDRTSRALFLACFRLCRVVGGGASAPDGLLARSTTSLPLLSGRESADVDRLRSILSSSRAIKEMTEEWLVDAGLSPVAREMVNLQSVKKASHARPSATPSRGGGGSGTRGAPERSGPERASGSPTASRPAKKLKTAVRKVPARSVARERDSAGPSRAAPLGEGPTVVDLSGGDLASRTSARPKSMRDLCRVSRSEGEEYRAVGMTSLPVGVPGAPYAARWPDLKADSRIWADGATAQEFVRGALHPALAKELYSCTSEVLADRAAKSLVWGQHYVMALIDRVLDAGRVIERQSNTIAALRLENQELRSSSGPEVVAAAEQRAAALDEEPWPRGPHGLVRGWMTGDLRGEGTSVLQEPWSVESKGWIVVPFGKGVL